MYRLYLPLFVTVLFAVVAAMLLIQTYFADDEELDIAYETTFLLLDERLEQGESIAQEIARVEQWFPYGIQFQTIDDLSLDSDEKQELLKTGFVFREIEGAVYIYRRSDYLADRFWVIQTEESNSDEDHFESIGSFKLVEAYIQQYDIEQWGAAIEKLNKERALYFELRPLNEFMESDLIKSKLDRLLLGRAQTNLSPGDLSYYYRIANSDWVLVAGPLPQRWWYTQWAYENAAILIFLVFVLVLAVAVLIWIWPLWSSLVTLLTAAQEFGAGNFGSRVSAGRFSPLKPVFSAFNVMAKRIQALIHSHKDLTNAVSHELRTPLARIRFGLEELLEAKSDDQRRHFYEEVATDINELDALINEMLVYASFERVRPAIEFSSIPLLPWLEEQFRRAKLFNVEKQTLLDTNDLAVGTLAQFESKLLARALSNLLHNASLHAKTTVRLSVKEEHQRFLFIVDDDGEGVPPHHREMIFEPFKRADSSRDRETGRFGIGLAIVEQVAAWHKGKCFVETAPIGGARFVFELPK